MDTNELVMKHMGELSFTTMINGYELALNGGKSNDTPDGITPKKLLLASLTGCTAMDVAGMLKTMRVDFSDFSVKVISELSQEHPKVYTSYMLTYTIKVKEKDQDKVRKAVQLSKEKYCGVSAMLSQSAPIQAKIVFL
jgi:putative redox protein